MRTERKIAEADGLAFLGLNQEAWEVLDHLPEAAQQRMDVVVIRIRICLGLEDWKRGAFWSSKVGRWDPEEYREAAGRFFFGKAVAWALEGRIQEALLPLCSLHLIWPEGREWVTGCRLLESVVQRSRLPWPRRPTGTGGAWEPLHL